MLETVFDLPAAFFYEELMAEYPQALFISSHREPEAWFRSFSGYLDLLTQEMFAPAQMSIFVRTLHKRVYGSELPEHDLWINSYNQHYAR